jgi:hypothetical protein
VWTGRDLPFTLQDKGYHFLDQNGIRMSQYLMLLLFAAADAIHDKEAPVDWPTVDVITNRNGLRKVLRSPFLLHTNEPCVCGSGKARSRYVERPP